MSHRIIKTDKAPTAVGPYSQAVVAGNLLFISGQLPINPETGCMVEGDIALSATQCMENIFAIAKSAGEGVHFVKVTIFLRSMADFSAVNEAYSKFFAENPPARECVAVAGLPKDAPIEISAIAVLS